MRRFISVSCSLLFVVIATFALNSRSIGTDFFSPEISTTGQLSHEASQNREMSHVASTSSTDASLMSQTLSDIISYSPAEAELSLHEPVIIYFTVSNNLAESIELDLGHNRKANFLLTVIRPNGSKTDLPRLSRMGLGRVGEMSLKPSETYQQRLLLNEWSDFDEPGRYGLVLRLAEPIRTQRGVDVNANTESYMELNILDKDVQRLEQVSAKLARRIDEFSSYEDAAEAALSLSYINHPVAVPYLREALASDKMVETVAAAGLERIGSEEAFQALSSVLDEKPEGREDIIRSTLNRMKQRTGSPHRR